QFPADREPRRRVPVLVRVVYGGRHARALGHVHRDVRRLHELVDSVAVLGVERDPEAGLDLYRDALDGEGVSERGLDALHEGGGLPLARTVQEEAELVATEAGDRL